MKLRLLSLLLLASAGFLTTSCSSWYGGIDDADALTGGVLPTEWDFDNFKYEQDNAPYNIVLDKFYDKRIPAAFITQPDDDIIVTYNPDTLPGRAPGYVRAVMESMFEQGSKPAERKVEVELRNVEMRIVTGNFASGRGGRYLVRLEAVARARDAAGNVLLKDKRYVVTHEGSRRLYEGRQLSERDDWKRMMTVTRFGVRELALQIGTDILQAKPNALIMTPTAPTEPATKPAVEQKPALPEPGLPPASTTPAQQ